MVAQKIHAEEMAKAIGQCRCATFGAGHVAGVVPDFQGEGAFLVRSEISRVLSVAIRLETTLSQRQLFHRFIPVFRFMPARLLNA